MANNYQGSGAERIGPWQEKLQEACSSQGLREPVYQVCSDRRGGRTAWSSTVEIQGYTFNARFWYDGQYLHNAKEDAAEVALQRVESGCFQQSQAAEQNWQGFQQNHAGTWTSRT